MKICSFQWLQIWHGGGVNLIHVSMLFSLMDIFVFFKLYQVGHYNAAVRAILPLKIPDSSLFFLSGADDGKMIMWQAREDEDP